MVLSLIGGVTYRAFTFYGTAFQRLLRLRLLSSGLQTTIRRTMRGDFHLELWPLHSPLLRPSLLVSFPPLSDMLKFSG